MIGDKYIDSYEHHMDLYQIPVNTAHRFYTITSIALKEYTYDSNREQWWYMYKYARLFGVWESQHDW